MYRRATKDDSESIEILVNAAYRPNGNDGWTHESHIVSGNRTNKEQVEELILRHGSVVLVGYRGEKLVSCVHVEKDGRDAYIGMLAVIPHLQGSGEGKLLLSKAEEVAVSEFSPERFVMVVVSAREELISFYERRGYSRTGRVEEYPLEAGVGVPMVAGLKIEYLEKRAN